MPRVAATHLRRGDRPLISARSRRQVTSVRQYNDERVLIWFSRWDEPITRLRLRGGTPWNAHALLVRPDFLFDTTLGPEHTTS